MTDIQARVAGFAQRFEHSFRREQPATFFAAEAELRDLVTDRTFPALINRALRTVSEKPYESGPWTLHQLVLCRGPGYALSLSLASANTRYIHSSPHLALLLPVRGTTLQYERYRLPAGYNNAVFDPSATLEPLAAGEVPHGDALHVHPEGEVVDLRIATPQLVLKLTSSAWHPLEWLFDRASRRAVQANDAALATTQLRVAAYLLGRLGQASSIEPLKQLATHNTPNVRWAAIQSLGRLSASEARVQLERVLDDPHPHLRRAARRTLGLPAAAEDGSSWR